VAPGAPTPVFGPPEPPARRWRGRGRGVLALGLSLGLHAALYVILRLTWLPPVDFDLELESDLDFGAAEAMLAVDPVMNGSEPPPLPPDEPLPAFAAPEDLESTFIVPRPDAGVPDAAVPDAAVPDAERPKPAPDAAPKPEPDAAPKSAAPDAAPPSTAPDAALPSTAPDAAPPSTPPSTPPDAGAPPTAPVVAANAPTDAGLAAGPAIPTAPPGLAASAPPGSVSLPAGAQLALRLDLALVRASPLAAEARSLLAAIPDWQMVLEGSGVEPVSAMDRVLIASPSLRRDRMVLAGSLAHGDDGLVRASVARLAATRGLPAAWQTVDGREVAPWANVDATPRHIALLDGRHFAIARLEDLPVVLALAEARAAAQSPGSAAPGSTPAGPADAGLPALTGPEALLWMPPDTVVMGEVDGARRLVRGASERVPERLRVALVALPDARAALEVEGSYATATELAGALQFAEARRKALLEDTVTALPLRMMGLWPLLAAAQFQTVEGTRIYLRIELNQAQLRAILTYIRAALEARAQRMAAAASASPPPASGPVSAPASRAAPPASAPRSAPGPASKNR
jgi:hypothetical protein